MRFRHCLGCMLLLLLPLHLPAQQATLTLKQVLIRVQQNYATYLSTLPSLYADEKLFSSLTFPRTSMEVMGALADGQRITYDSIFRVKRIHTEGNARQELQETRQVISVDHQPATPQQALAAPSMVIGAFDYAPKVLVAGVAPCFDYKLRPSRRWQGRTVVVLEYSSAQPAQMAHVGCRNDEPNSGRVLIDAESMQVVRIEQTRPKHSPEINTLLNLSLPPEANGIWKWSIDYTMVTLEGRSFSLPKTITSTFEIFSHPHVLWSSQSSYSHYQLADVHSKVVLPDGTSVPQP